MVSEAEIYTLDIKRISRTDIDAAYFSMSPERRKKCDGLRNQSDKDLCIVSDMLLRRVLSEKLGISPSELVFAVTDKGKPYLESGAYHFSVSHSGDIAAVAVNRACPVGIDVEKIRPVSARILLRFFSEGDARFVLGGSRIENGIIEDREMMIRFFKVWTYKEAFVKMTGEGIGVDLKSFPYEESNCVSRTFDDYVLTVITE
ncbi:MAG: 4'-phosphopantetheinyl transferase superfamily protein [Clostridia bacterium]|nr:4'-phosphopantetheinyl transferase superfamily protein [Clostridia bacterium]